MAQDFARKFYSSHSWEVCRRAYLMSVVETAVGPCPPGLCERCLELGELTPAKVVHHIEHLTPENIHDPSVTLSFDNLQRLCQDCHAFVHSGQGSPRVRFGPDGRALPFRETLRDVAMRLTEPEGESRNIHRRGSHAAA